MFDGNFRVHFEKALRPVGESLRRTGLSPDHFTLLGLVVAAAASVAIGAGYLQLGLLLELPLRYLICLTVRWRRRPILQVNAGRFLIR